MWAHIEFTLDAAIWEMSGSIGSTGPAITAQIMGVRGRTNAISAMLEDLSATLEDLSATKRMKSKVNEFSQRVNGLGQRRNRAVHDVWLWLETENEAYQFRVEANAGRIGFGLEPRPLSALQHDLEEIDAFRHRCVALKDDLLKWFRALPEARRSAMRPFRA
jgi:hypothetical protein